MSGGCSIRLRLVNWLHRVGYHRAKNAMDCLRGREVHPEASANICHRCSSFIENTLSQRQKNYAVEVPGFGNKVDIPDLGVIPGNHPSLAAHFKDIAFNPNISLIHDQPSPVGKNYASTLTGKTAGVES